MGVCAAERSQRGSPAAFRVQQSPRLHDSAFPPCAFHFFSSVSSRPSCQVIYFIFTLAFDYFYRLSYSTSKSEPSPKITARLTFTAVLAALSKKILMGCLPGPGPADLLTLSL